MRIIIVSFVRSFLAFFGLFCLLFVQKAAAQCPSVGTALKSSAQIFPLNSSCAAPILRPNDLLSPAQTAACESQLIVQISFNGQPVAQPIPANLHGQVLQVLVTNNVGWFMNGTVRFLDQTPPTISAPPVFLVCGQPTGFNDLPMPVLMDNCTGQTFLKNNLTAIDADSVLVPAGCANAHTRIIKRTFEARDQAGNTARATQIIHIKRLTPDLIVFPPDTVRLQACVNNLGQLNLTGRPLANGVFPIPLVCFSYETQQDIFMNATCAPGTKWQRIWTVGSNDACGSFMKKDTQIIFLEDRTAPVLACQPDLVRQTDAGKCFASVAIPTLTATDVCGSPATRKIGLLSHPFNSMGDVLELPPGEHFLNYYATDCSGDSTFCNLKITVDEKQSPTLVCTGKPTVSIIGTSKAVVPTTALVKFLSDNCAAIPPTVTVKRADETVFRNELTVRCADVNQKVAYVIRAVDLFGNATECEDTITVRDKLGPIFSVCPADKTVNCLDPNIYNVSAFGTAVAFDSCGISLVDYDEKDDLTACGFGTITRTWTAYDVNGNSSVCDQTIAVVAPASSKFTAANIKWPENHVSFACASGTNLDPSSLPPGADKPTFSGQFCGNPFSSYHDVVYNSAAPACYKIVRKWTVIDWCVAVPTIGAGKWEFFQTVSVMDTIRPKLLLPKNDTFGLNSTCSAATVAGLKASATDCSNSLTWRQMVGNQPNPFATNPNSDDLSGNYPPGQTVVKVIVRDGCGLESAGVVTIFARDLKKPTPLCPGVLSINLAEMSAGGPPMAMVNASQFNFQSFDNCTAANQLVFKIKKWKLGDPNIPATDDQLTYSCLEQGTNIVQFWATDGAGNSDFCTTLLLVQPNMADCPPTALPISGEIVTELGQKVEHVAVDLPNSTVAATAMTDQNGAFSLPNLPAGSAFSVRPKRNDEATNGISTYDLVLLSRHILGVQPLATPYQRIAADVNRSNTISTLDVVELRKVLFGIYPSMPNNDSWRFVDAGYQFTDPTNPLAENFPEIKQIGQLSAPTAANFVGIKVGDLNASAAANDGFSAVDDRGGDEELAFFTDDLVFEKGQTLRVPVRAEAFERMLGLQGTFEFDRKKLRLADVLFSKKLPGFGLQNLGYDRADEGLVALSFDAADGADLADGEPLIELVFEAAEKGKLAESLAFSDRILKAEAYEKGQAEGDKRRRPTLGFLKNPTAAEPKKEPSKAAEKANLTVSQNRPNPFSEATEIDFSFSQLVENERVTLKVFDLAGREIFSTSQILTGEKGQFRLEKIDLPNGTRGAFFYRVETEKWAASRRLILL